MTLSLGEKLEMAFSKAKVSSKIIGNNHPVSFADISLDGTDYRLTRNVNASMPWFWKLEVKASFKTILLKDEWDLPAIA